MVVTRTGWTGEVGYEIYLRDGSRGVELWERVMAAGKPHNIRPTGPSDIRRVEAGILNWGADMTLDNNPYEVGLGWLVDSDKKHGLHRQGRPWRRSGPRACKRQAGRRGDRRRPASSST